MKNDVYSKDICFCTLAIGKRYNAHAALLARDLKEQAPKYVFLVLSDRPHLFRNFENTIALKHSQKSIGCFHDKREVIKQALMRFDSCLFLDSDVRVISKVPDHIDWKGGITAFSRSGFVKHLNAHSGSSKNRSLIEKVTKRLGLNLTDERLKFVQEFCFAVSKFEGREWDFLNYWEKISNFLELNGFTHAEGFTIGLAAAKAEFPIHYRGEAMEEIKIFKDWLERDRKRQGHSTSEKVLQCWRQHEEIEFLGSGNFLNKFLSKVSLTAKRKFLTFKLKFRALFDAELND